MTVEVYRWKVGDRVSFAHQPLGPAHTIEAVGKSFPGISNSPFVQLHELPGQFAAHLFVAAPAEWPEIPEHLENPLVFRDANLGIVLVSGPPGDQMIWRKHRSEISGFHWCSVRKVDERDGFRMVDALNLPAPIDLPPVTVEAKAELESKLSECLAHSRETGSLHVAVPVPVLETLIAEMTRLRLLINTPEIVDFGKAVQLEAVHQRERWGSKQDEGKSAADWFWLLGYLAGKALHSDKVGDRDKLLHHVITTAAACANWHAQVLGNCDMRPGIQTPAGEK